MPRIKPNPRWEKARFELILRVKDGQYMGMVHHSGATLPSDARYDPWPHRFETEENAKACMEAMVTPEALLHYAVPRFLVETDGEWVETL
jgi:hypothetical protein